MELRRLLDQHAEQHEETWLEAQAVVDTALLLPSPLINLTRSSWSGVLAPSDFVKMLGFTGVNPSCLVNAAELPTDGSVPRTEDVSTAVQTLGMRYSAVVLAVNVCVRCVLKRKPGPGWKTLLEQTATDMEIGYKLGVRVGELGLEGGLLIGFADYLGVALLSATKHEDYKLYSREVKKFGTLGSKRVLELFGCEPHQVAAIAVQRLGFGPELAFGVALSVGRLNPKHIRIGEEVLRWKAGYEWLQALKEGRNYPGNLAMRNYFPAIAPPKDRSKKNTLLEVLYTEVAKTRRDGSRWTWHLPKPGYERTKEAFDL